LLLVVVEQVTIPRLLRPWIHINLAGLALEQATATLLEGVVASTPTASQIMGRVELDPDGLAQLQVARADARAPHGGRRAP
jgi:hypothetical protein